jgi:hypothetical protein
MRRSLIDVTDAYSNCKVGETFLQAHNFTSNLQVGDAPSDHSSTRRGIWLPLWQQLGHKYERCDLRITSNSPPASYV